jgi:hypothetical protein
MNGQGFGQNARQGREGGGLGRGRGLGRGNCQGNRFGAPDAVQAQGDEGVPMIARPGEEAEPAQGGFGGRFGARRGMAARAGQAAQAGFGGQGACCRQRRRDGSCGQQG